MTELKELNDFWDKKYPHVTVTLWANVDEDTFFGKMITADNSTDLCATTIGELISQGETFLRSNKVKHE